MEDFNEFTSGATIEVNMHLTSLLHSYIEKCQEEKTDSIEVSLDVIKAAFILAVEKGSKMLKDEIKTNQKIRKNQH